MMAMAFLNGVTLVSNRTWASTLVVRSRAHDHVSADTNRTDIQWATDAIAAFLLLVGLLIDAYTRGDISAGRPELQVANAASFAFLLFAALSALWSFETAPTLSLSRSRPVSRLAV